MAQLKSINAAIRTSYSIFSYILALLFASSGSSDNTVFNISELNLVYDNDSVIVNFKWSSKYIKVSINKPDVSRIMTHLASSTLSTSLTPFLQPHQ